MWNSLKLDKRLQEVERRCDDAERQFKQLQLEWDSTYDKLRAVVQRIAKRAERNVEIVEGKEVAEREGFSAASSPTDGLTGPLTPRARSIQAKILARRAMFKGQTQ